MTDPRTPLALDPATARGLLDAVPLPLLIYDLETLFFLAVNRTAIAHSGWSEAELLGRQVTLLRTPEERERLLALEWRPELQQRSTGRWQSRTKDGAQLQLDVFAQDLLWSGRRARLLALHDVTERERTETALRESEERFRIAFHTSPDALNLVRIEDGVWVTANLGFTKITGWTEEEIIGKTGAQIGLWHDEDVRLRMYAALKQTGEFRDAETRFRTKSGTLVDCTLSAQVIQLGGKPFLLAVTRDNTERKRAERERDSLQEELRHAQKMEAVGRLAGGVAHDFNNMLTVIGNVTEFVLADLPEGSPLREDLEQIKEATARATSLTAQLLAFSRRQFLQPKLVDLNQLVAQLERLLRRVIGEHIELSCALCAQPLSLQVDPSRLEQALVNLVVNARDAMPRGGRLLLETAAVTLGAEEGRLRSGLPAGPYVQLSVSDTGVGMDAETRRRAFEPFFTTKGSGGTGLGLATVYGIVKQSGGEIRLYSEPGQGTTFRLWFPAAAENPGTTPVEAPAPSEGASRPASGTVLVVEDEALVGDIVRASLQRLGYRVLLAASGEAAERIAREEQGAIDLLLTDVVMPGMDGPEVVTRLTALRPGLRVLYMSGYTENAVVQRGVLEHGIEFLEKPFTQDALAKAVARLLPARPES